MLPAAFTAICFALATVSAGRSSLLLGAARANLCRLLVAICALGAWSHAFGSGLESSALTLFLIAGAIGFGAGGFSIMQALPKIGSPLASLSVECGAAVAASAIAWAWLGETLTARQLAFIAMILTGVALGLWPERKRGIEKSALKAGILWCALASLGQGLSFAITRQAFLTLAREGEAIGKLDAAYLRLLGGGAAAFALLAIPAALRASRGGAPLPKPVPPEGLSGGAMGRYPPLWVALNALFGPILGVTLMLWAISLTNPGIAQSIAATAPLFTVPFARWAEGRRPSTGWVAGAGLSILGLAGLFLDKLIFN